MQIRMVHDLVEKNGKTIKENNLEKPHTIPIGSLVEIKSTGERTYVCQHMRDCDGTPLYATCSHEDLSWNGTKENWIPKEIDPKTIIDSDLLNKFF